MGRDYEIWVHRSDRKCHISKSDPNQKINPTGVRVEGYPTSYSEDHQGTTNPNMDEEYNPSVTTIHKIQEKYILSKQFIDPKQMNGKIMHLIGSIQENKIGEYNLIQHCIKRNREGKK